MIFVKYLFGDLGGVTNNILSEVIGLVISIIIVRLIFANRWKSVQERVRKQLKIIIDTSIFRLRLGLDIFPEEENWGERNVIKEIEVIKNTDIKNRLIQLSVHQLNHLLNLIEKIESDLIKIQDKTAIRPIPELWIVLDTLETNLGSIKNYLSEYNHQKELADGKQIVFDKIFPSLIVPEITESISSIINLKKIIEK